MFSQSIRRKIVGIALGLVVLMIVTSILSTLMAADVADHGPGRLDWADSAPKGIASGRIGVQAKPVIPLRARSGLNRRLC
jgi:hypothetical protein